MYIWVNGNLLSEKFVLLTLWIYLKERGKIATRQSKNFSRCHQLFIELLSSLHFYKQTLRYDKSCCTSLLFTFNSNGHLTSALFHHAEVCGIYEVTYRFLMIFVLNLQLKGWQWDLLMIFKSNHQRLARVQTAESEVKSRVGLEWDLAYIDHCSLDLLMWSHTREYEWAYHECSNH